MVIIIYDDIDINECTTNNGGCSADANCSNTVGSFTCTCHNGFTGDGFNCTGESDFEYPEYIVWLLYIFM